MGVGQTLRTSAVSNGSIAIEDQTPWTSSMRHDRADGNSGPPSFMQSETAVLHSTFVAYVVPMLATMKCVRSAPSMLTKFCYLPGRQTLYRGFHEPPCRLAHGSVPQYRSLDKQCVCLSLLI